MGFMWRSLRRLHQKAYANAGTALADLAHAEVKTEACKNGLPAQFLDIPDDVSKYWWRTGRSNRRLLVRNCYEPIFNLTWEHNTAGSHDVLKGVVLLGNPGIGKTGFLWLSLWKLLKKKVSVILRLPDNLTYVCASWRGDALSVEEYGSLLSIPGGMWDNGEPWYLADRRIEPSDWFLGCKFLLTCSPLKANYSEFAKGGGVQLLYDPVWTLDEILALNEHNFGHDAEEVKERYRMWGGVPRYVLDKVGPLEHGRLKHAMGLVREFQEIIKLQALPENQSHKAFHIIVDETYASFKLAPASAYVQQKLVESLPLPALKAFLSMPQEEDIWDIQGKLLEQFLCDVVVPRGGTLRFRELQPSGEFGPTFDASFPAAAPKYDLPSEGRGRHAVFPKDLPPTHEAAFFKPLSSSNADWDFIANGGIYQVTVSKARELPLRDGLLKALEFLRLYYGQGKKLDFYFLVPAYNLSSFTVDWFATEKAEVPSANRRTAADKAGLVNRAMQRIKKLNIKVKVASMDIGDVCSACMGTGVVAPGHVVVSAISSLKF